MSFISVDCEDSTFYIPKYTIYEWKNVNIHDTLKCNSIYLRIGLRFSRGHTEFLQYLTECEKCGLRELVVDLGWEKLGIAMGEASRPKGLSEEDEEEKTVFKEKNDAIPPIEPLSREDEIKLEELLGDKSVQCVHEYAGPIRPCKSATCVFKSNIPIGCFAYSVAADDGLDLVTERAKR
jgi:hypothetical protein